MFVLGTTESRVYTLPGTMLAVTLNAGMSQYVEPPPAGTEMTLPAGLPNTGALIGFNLYLQAGFSDAAAVKGVSLSKGLRMEIG